MNKLFKRVITLVLSVSMIVTMLPDMTVTAQAEELQEILPATDVDNVEPENGYDLESYEITEDRVLDITSNDYTGESNKPELCVSNGIWELSEGWDYEVEYFVDDVSTSDIVDAGEYTVVIRGINEYYGEVRKKYVVNKIYFSAFIDDWTYGEDPKTPAITGNPDPEHVKVEYKRTNERDSAYSETVPVNAGEYQARVTVDTDMKNYFAGSDTCWFKINKAKIDVKDKKPEGKMDLIYNGEDQVLITPPEDVSGGEWTYAVQKAGDPTPSSDDYKAELPTGKNAGGYYVYYKFVQTDKENYENAVMSTAAKKVIARISQGNYNYKIKGSDWIYGQKAPEFSLVSNPDEANVTFYYKKQSDPDTKYKEYLPGQRSGYPVNADAYVMKAVIDPTDNCNEAEAYAYFSISPKEITEDMVSFENSVIRVYEDNAEPVSPVLVVKYEEAGKTLTEDVDFGICVGSETSASEPGTYTITIGGSGNYSGTVSVKWKLIKMEKSVDGDDQFAHSAVDACIYNGQAQTPEPVVEWNGTTLEKGKDYTLSYKNNVNAGSKTAKDKKTRPQIIVKGKGKYSGSMTIYFDILPREINDGDSPAEDILAYASDKPYTGKVNKSAPVMKFTNEAGKVFTLKEGTDYKVTYNPSKPKAVGDVVVTVEGKKNYTGTLKLEYSILPVSKDYKDAVVVKIPDQPYKGEPYTYEEIQNLVVVKTSKAKNAAIIPSSEYKVEFMPENPVNVGKVTVSVCGTEGHAELWKTVTFNIVPKNVSEDDLLIEADDVAVFTGKAVTLNVDITDPVTKEKLTSKDYSVSYKNNVNVASKDAVKTVNKKKKSIAPTMTITFKGNYKGTVTRKFDIEPKKLTASNIVIKQADVKNKGKITGDSLAPVVKVDGVTVKNKKDYTVSFTPVEGKEMQTATVTFKGNYEGSKDFTFRLYNAATDIKSNSVHVLRIFDSAEYTGEKIKFPVGVVDTIDGVQVTLEEGKDYTVTYKNNVNAASAKAKKHPSVTVKGIGAYKGSITKSFTISPKSLDELHFDITVSDIKYTGKAVKPSVTVKDKESGKVLKAGKDYKVTYANNVKLSDGSEEEPVAVVKGIGNYTDSSSKKFRIYKIDVNALYVEGVKANVAYTGSPIKPEIKVYSDKKKKNLVDPSMYTVEYGENTETGKGTVTITGLVGTDLGGTKTVKFNILPKALKWLFK